MFRKCYFFNWKKYYIHKNIIFFLFSRPLWFPFTTFLTRDWEKTELNFSSEHVVHITEKRKKEKFSLSKNILADSWRNCCDVTKRHNVRVSERKSAIQLPCNQIDLYHLFSLLIHSLNFIWAIQHAIEKNNSIRRISHIILGS